MKKILVVVLALSFILAGCGNSSPAYPKEIEDAVESIKAEGTTEENLRNLISLFENNRDKSENGYRREIIKIYDSISALGIYEAEDFAAQGSLYLEDGKAYEAVKSFERAYRLSPDDSLLEKAESIIIPLEKSPALFKQVEDVISSLKGDGSGNTLEGLLSDVFNDTLAPKTKLGYRTYTLSNPEGKAETAIKVGFDDFGNENIYLWNLENEEINYIYLDKEELIYLTSGYSNDNFNGKYTLEQLSIREKSILKEEGSFKDGIITGEVTSSASFDNSFDSVIDLWKNKDSVSYIDYKGSFSDEGHTLEKQLPNVVGNNSVIYAYSENGKKFLYMPVAETEDAESYVFDYSSLGVKKVPENIF